jgi:hypothetical protein
MTRHQANLMPARDQPIGKIPNEPLTAAPLLGPENVTGKPDPDGWRI